MSRKKGVSAEEKQIRMLQLFHESKSFYQLQDLEKIAPKEKGIIANSVKDVISKLVDQGLVETDKIGSSIYYWSFPSQATNKKKKKLEDLTKQITKYSEELTLIEEKLEKLKENEEENKQKIAYLDKTNDLTLISDELLNKLKQYEDNDPQVLKNKRDQIEEIKVAANRWTDNIFSIKSWCKTKFGMESSVFDKQFGIPSEFDYLE